MIRRRSFLQSAYALFLPIVGSSVGPAEPPTEIISVPIPGGYTAHLENPNVVIDRTGTIFATTRPNSGVGSFVWMIKDGVSSIILDLGPDKSYALGEFFIDQRNGWLYFTTVEKEDHTKLVCYPIPQWTP